MAEIESYIGSQPQHLQALFSKLRYIVLQSAPQISEKMRYGIPFFDYYSWMCYLSPFEKTKGVYIAFLRGFELSNEQGILEAGDRKMVKSITYKNIKDIDEKLLSEILQEAMLLNEWHMKNKGKK